MQHATAVVRGFRNPSAPGIERGAVLGNYDGLHIGHQALLKTLSEWKQKREGREVSLVTFYPHPLKVLKGVTVPVLTSVRQSRSILASYGIDYLHLLRFSRALSEMEAEHFIKEKLLGRLNLQYLLVGPDAAVGKDRAGTVDVLQRIFARQGATVEVQDFERTGEQKIGSVGVRKHVESGSMAHAYKLLGRPYKIDGKVVAGAARGRSIGFPTANVRPGNFQLPQFGVYATRVCLQGVVYDAVTNVGVRPTVEGSQPLIESFLLTYSGPSFYGERISIAFYAQLRKEQQFENLSALKAQIARDVQSAVSYLKHGVREHDDA